MSLSVAQEIIALNINPRSFIAMWRGAGWALDKMKKEKMFYFRVTRRNDLQPDPPPMLSIEMSRLSQTAFIADDGKVYKYRKSCKHSFLFFLNHSG